MQGPFIIVWEHSCNEVDPFQRNDEDYALHHFLRLLDKCLHFVDNTEKYATHRLKHNKRMQSEIYSVNTFIEEIHSVGNKCHIFRTIARHFDRPHVDGYLQIIQFYVQTCI